MVVRERLRLARPFLEEPDRRGDVKRKLEKLGLPVLHDRAPEVGRHDVAAPGDGLRAVFRLLGVVVVLPGKRLSQDRRDEQDEEEE